MTIWERALAMFVVWIGALVLALCSQGCYRAHVATDAGPGDAGPMWCRHAAPDFPAFCTPSLDECDADHNRGEPVGPCFWSDRTWGLDTGDR